MSNRSRLITWGLPLLAVLAGLYATQSIFRTQPVRKAVEPSIQPPVQPAQVAAVTTAGYIGSAGLVEAAGQETAVGTPVSGLVTSVAAVPGGAVKAGDVLFELDQRSAAATVELRRAERDVARHKLAQTEARIPALEAAVKAARAAADATRAELADLRDQRQTSEDLKAQNSGALTLRELTRRRNAERAATARLSEAEARTAQAEVELALVAAPSGAATLEVERANVRQADAALARAEADLALLRVTSPVDGTVLQVNVRPGEFAQAGALTTPLVVLGRLDPLHVRVDIDEADIGRFTSGAAAYASLRGQAERRATLMFVRVEPYVVPKRALTGSSVERVDTRVLRVIYALPSGVLAAYPGQQVDVFIAAAAPAPEPPRLSSIPAPGSAKR